MVNHRLHSLARDLGFIPGEEARETTQPAGPPGDAMQELVSAITKIVQAVVAQQVQQSAAATAPRVAALLQAIQPPAQAPAPAPQAKRPFPDLKIIRNELGQMIRLEGSDGRIFKIIRDSEGRMSRVEPVVPKGD